MIVAADHPARGALRAGADPLAMADRADLLDRLCTALARPGVDGVLGTADILEDLLLLGALDDKVVIGSMNRGGLAGTAFEIDDRFTGYDAASIAAAGFEGGKMLLRIDPDDAGTAPTLEACAQAVSDLAGTRLMAMVEPFISHRVDGRVRNDLTRRGGDPGRRRSPPGSARPRPTPGSSCRSSTTWSGCWPRPRCRCCCSAARSRPTRTRAFAQLEQGAGTAHRAGHGRRPLAALPAGRRRRRAPSTRR